MDPFLQEELFWVFSPEQHDLLPAALPPAVMRQSAFEQYSGRPPPNHRSTSAPNIHRRVIDLVRKIPKLKPETRAGEESRGFRHMMRERQRREKLSQSYADLYSMISSRSKPDKNSIVQSAAVFVKEMKGVKEGLRRRNEELKLRLAGGKVATGTATAGEPIKIQVTNTETSAVDSMIDALRFLKSMDVKATAIRSEFSGNGLSAVVSVDTNKVRAAELERGVEEAVKEEGKVPVLFPRSSGLDPSRARFGALSSKVVV